MKKTSVVLLALILVLLAGIALADPAMVTLSDSGITATATGTTIDGNKLTISAPGEYIISGSLSNGQIVVNSENEGKITLYLNGVTINNDNGPAIMILKASPRVTISMMEGTVNTLTGGTDYIFETDDEPNAVIFSRSDMTITGEGALNVKAAMLDGIASKDDLRIKSGTITIEAARHGLRGKDCVEITGGTFSIVAGKDAIRSTNTKTNTEGYVSISDANITIVCGSEPIHAITGVTIENTGINAKIISSKKE